MNLTSLGGKFIIKRGFVAEIYLGIGRDLLEGSTIEVVGRGGISFGYILYIKTQTPSICLGFVFSYGRLELLSM